jgi:hypothetical protein
VIVTARTGSRSVQSTEFTVKKFYCDDFDIGRLMLKYRFARLPLFRVRYHLVAVLKLRPRESAGED